MSEWQLVWLTPLKVIPTVLFMFAYVIGGRTMKWIRRWVGASIFIVCCVLLSWYANTLSWKSFSLGSLYLGLILGYGGNTFFTKLARRFFYAVALGGSGLLIGLMYRNWILGVWQLTLALQASLILGLTNPDDAVDEEGMIAIFSVAVIPFMVA